MPVYVYACSTHKTHRKEVIHSVSEEPQVSCGLCGEQMHRVPQPFMHYNNPVDTIFSELNTRYRAYRGRFIKRRNHARP